MSGDGDIGGRGLTVVVLVSVYDERARVDTYSTTCTRLGGKDQLTSLMYCTALALYDCVL